MGNLGISGDAAAIVLMFIMGIWIGLSFQKSLPRRRRWRRKGSDWQGWNEHYRNLAKAPEKLPDAADQLRTVMKADFKAQPLLNKSEARLLDGFSVAEGKALFDGREIEVRFMDNAG